MKVLAVVGTTRKRGDNYHVIREIEASLRRMGGVEVEYLFLSEFELGFCLGCCACIFKGEEHCPKRALTRQIEGKMLEADGVILAAPVYGHQVPALLKNFIDHFCYFFHRPRFFDKVAVIVATTGGSGLQETVGYMKFTAIGWGFTVAGSLGVVSRLFQENGAYREDKLNEINGLAARMVRLIESGRRPAPSLFELMFFRGIRYKAKMNPCDRRYWEERGWLTGQYFVKTPIHPVKLLLAGLAEKTMGLTERVKMGKYR
ncbi:multimeric flavodoxin WrbA [Hydrogenispora ethanolica]|jgi:multimeric flavodoxin WrbA|uniref:Multimeric flavodoxin WrbA n=1 Tax=Hydrogenispora ethanolica TaxID=1082276 RepID=A0A4R1R9G0_HYDET|nr:NAD(P)H-dependent oxidoreductase [Hydrogenispora ethanolica]TCL62315.1 multimeric flavodoxin WrbA [Hydrogenispora ethanolica]